MEAKLIQDFITFPWWGYLLGLLGGTLFGALQVWLLRLSVWGENPRRWLILVKFSLWMISLVVLALCSFPLLAAFVVAATIMQFVGVSVCYQRARKEAK